MSGPPKTPSNLVLLKGNPGKRAINKDEPKPAIRVPPLPSHFSKRAKYWHKRVAEELAQMQVLTGMDERALELLIEAYDEYRQHIETLEEEGYTYKTTSTEGAPSIKMHPAAALKADAWKRIRAMLTEFGMTPASRTKVKVSGPGETDPLEEFLARKR
ncbi:phage terminase small subunit P27 family [Escherichia coli]|nr:phage terminase small subunit P27 family [Escherichia coli]EMC3009628.1 phage terminase small subunit P27 family [Escherichia coli]EMC6800468.1 phage terminase small subunit P27 family [Escherichia coli]